jgi:Hg(II)-responsive transcriptional regulator
MALTIGKVAKAANVHVETLRYYERRGLLPKPPSLSMYRRYPENTVRQVRFVRHAQALGFSLREIRELLSLRAAPKARCADVKRRADIKLRDIEEKIRMLQAMHRALRRLVSQCDGKLPASECPILESLDDESLHDGKEAIE